MFSFNLLTLKAISGFQEEWPHLTVFLNLIVFSLCCMSSFVSSTYLECLYSILIFLFYIHKHWLRLPFLFSPRRNSHCLCFGPLNGMPEWRGTTASIFPLLLYALSAWTNHPVMCSIVVSRMISLGRLAGSNRSLDRSMSKLSIGWTVDAGGDHGVKFWLQMDFQ